MIIYVRIFQTFSNEREQMTRSDIIDKGVLPRTQSSFILQKQRSLNKKTTHLFPLNPVYAAWEAQWMILPQRKCVLHSGHSAQCCSLEVSFFSPKNIPLLPYNNM